EPALLQRQHDVELVPTLEERTQEVLEDAAEVDPAEEEQDSEPVDVARGFRVVVPAHRQTENPALLAPSSLHQFRRRRNERAPRGASAASSSNGGAPASLARFSACLTLFLSRDTSSFDSSSDAFVCRCASRSRSNARVAFSRSRTARSSRSSARNAVRRHSSPLFQLRAEWWTASASSRCSGVSGKNTSWSTILTSGKLLTRASRNAGPDAALSKISPGSWTRRSRSARSSRGWPGAEPITVFVTRPGFTQATRKSEPSSSASIGRRHSRSVSM